jgi:hypothetical protein
MTGLLIKNQKNDPGWKSRGSRPARRAYWVIQKTTLDLGRRLLEIRTALDLTPRRRRFIARALGGDFLQARIN